MLSRLYSLKFIIGAALLWLGALAFGLAIYSTQVYREHALQTQIETLQGELELESSESIQDLYDRLKVFALRLQGEAPFKQALAAGDRQALESWLGQSYSRYPVARGLFKLKAIMMRDLAGEIVVRSSVEALSSYQGCGELLESINVSMIRLLKPRYVLCSYDNYLLAEVLVPVGTLQPQAYLQIIADAGASLQDIEQKIGMPISVENGSGKLIFRSEKWLDTSSGTHLYPVYKLYGDDAFSAQPYPPPTISNRC